MDIALSLFVNGVWDRVILDAYHREWEQIQYCLERQIEPPELIPRMEDIVESAFRELQTEERAELIEQAIQRRDHWLLYGYTNANEFAEAAWKGEINDPALLPRLNYNDVMVRVLDFVFENRLFILDYHQQIRNAPIREVW